MGATDWQYSLKTLTSLTSQKRASIKKHLMINLGLKHVSIPSTHY
jgi:hypothetical protein